MDLDHPSKKVFSWLKSCTRQEILKTSQLCHAIESLLPPESLLTGFAMPPPARSGVGAVDVLAFSGPTVVVITPSGTLLLLLQEDLDASTAELVMNSIKTFTEGQGDMIVHGEGVDYHNQIMDVDEAGATRLKELEDTERLLQAMREIAETSEDAESVRLAFIVLTQTTLGLQYIKENPIPS